MSHFLLLVTFTLGVGQANAGTESDTLFLHWAKELTLPEVSSGIDEVVDIEVDATGNVYVTGKSEGPGTSYDYLTVKYGNDGAARWTARYDGPYHGPDIPAAIAVDNQGNVYVTGMSVGDTTYGDIATIKYNSAGEEEWIERYDGPHEWGGDAGVDIAVDMAGSVYVAGYREGEPWGRHDFVTLKYSPQGELQWTSVYSSSTGFDDEPIALALDRSGSIYVAGRSQTNWDVADLTVVKYDSEGNEGWVFRRNFPDSAWMVPAGMVVTDDGLWMTATAQHNVQSYLTFSSDIFTLKLSADGVEEWGSIFDGGEEDGSSSSILEYAKAIGVDNEGSAYITGITANDRDEIFRLFGDSLLTLKYSQDGSLNWVSHYNDSPGQKISSRGLTLDGAGGIYITGTRGSWSDWPLFTGESIVTISYDSNGSIVWENAHPAEEELIGSNAIAARNGYVYVPGFTGTDRETDFLTLKYTDNGSEVWNTTTTGSGLTAGFVHAVEVDNDGNIYVACVGIDLQDNKDYTVLKVSPSGNILWSSSYGGGPGWLDLIHDIAIDDAGNSFVTGQSGNWGTGSDYVTIKYDVDGEQMWVARYDSASEDQGRVVAIGPSGSLYVGGYPSLLTYDANGNPEWSRATDGMVSALAVDDSGNVYSVSSELRKYSASGVLQWSAEASGQSIAIDDSGSIYVSGGFTSKFDSFGNQLWRVPVGGDKIVIYDSDHIYASASTWVYRLTGEGSVVWLRGFLQCSCVDSDIDVDKYGNVYMTGWNWSADQSPVVIQTVMYDPDGNEQTNLIYAREGGGEYRVGAIGLNSIGEILVVGEQIGADFSSTPIVLKYSRNGITDASPEDGENISTAFRLYQNYPNPFNPATTISFDLPNAELVELKIFNILGQEVATVVNEELNAGAHSMSFEASNLATGVYFYRLQAGDYVATKRLMLVK